MMEVNPMPGQRRDHIEDLKVQGAFFIKDDNKSMFKDGRGAFWQMAQWSPHTFVQANYSTSHHGVIRGMHVQTNNPQGKLVLCLYGELMDVVHDVRFNSPTAGKTDHRILKMGQGLYLPPGTAHGFQCLSERCDIVYLCTTHYDPNCDAGFIYWDAEAPWQTEHAIVSMKDMGLPRRHDLVGRVQWMK